MERRTGLRCDLAVDMAESEGMTGRIECETLSGKYGVKREKFVIRSRAEEEKTGLKRGCYVTLSRKGIYPETDDEKIYFERCLAKSIKDTISIIGLKDDFSVLVLGLGNGYMTADAVGKRTVEKIITTRKADYGKNLRKVCAFAASVSGITGIDSFEIAEGLTREISPDLIICVDSLCAFRTDRIGRSYQLSSCGIKAGSGSDKPGGKRLCEESLGVPVLAIGVPFVVSARRLLHDACSGEVGFDPVSPEEDMYVTLRDVDAVLTECSEVVAAAINIALQPSFDVMDVLMSAR